MADPRNAFLQNEQKNSIHDVMDLLTSLEKELPELHFSMLHNFNYAYFIITKNVQRELQKGGFKYPDFLVQFDVRFARYYIRALQAYSLQLYTPPAWQRAFEKAELGEASPLMCMALGVNAHVNNDIPQVLKDCGARLEHYPDYKKVNEIIRDSIDEVIESLDKDTHLLNPKQKLLKPVYKSSMNVLIRLWRRQAWTKFVRLQRQELRIIDIERSAGQLAKDLWKLPA
jgi:hypothetical protein